jgi:hypothetical protein
MLNARLTVDLPSVETLRRMGPVEWLQSLFGRRIDLHNGEEELIIGALALVQALYNAFRNIGVTNAISLLVDKKVLYADAHEVENDLDLILRRLRFGADARKSGYRPVPTRQPHLAFATLAYCA